MILGQGGGRSLGGLAFLVGVAGGALSKSMTNYERRPNYVALKPMWKANIGWLFIIAMIVSASILALGTK